MSAPVEPLALESITALKQSVLEFLTTVDAVYATHPTATNGLTLLKSRALPILTFVQRLEVNIRFRDMQREREGFQDHTLAQFHAEQREAFESNNTAFIEVRCDFQKFVHFIENPFTAFTDHKIELLTLQAEVDTCRETNKKSIETATREREEYKKSIEKSQSEWQAEVAQLKLKQPSFETTLTVAFAERDDLAKRVQQLQASKDELDSLIKSMISRHATEIEALQQKSNGDDEALATLHEKEMSRCSDSECFNEKIALQDQINTIQGNQTHHHNLNQQLCSLSEKYYRRKQKLSIRKRKIDRRDQLIKTHDGQLEKEKERYAKKVFELETQIDMLSSKIKNDSTSNKSLEAQVAKGRKTNESLTVELREAKRKYVDLKQKYKEALEAGRKQEATLGDYKEDNKRLRRKNKKMVAVLKRSLEEDNDLENEQDSTSSDDEVEIIRDDTGFRNSAAAGASSSSTARSAQENTGRRSRLGHNAPSAPPPSMDEQQMEDRNGFYKVRGHHRRLPIRKVNADQSSRRRAD